MRNPEITVASFYNTHYIANVVYHKELKLFTVLLFSKSVPRPLNIKFHSKDRSIALSLAQYLILDVVISGSEDS